MWRAPCVNINIKYQHSPRMHHTNGNDQVMDPKLSGNPTIVVNISSHLKRKYIYKLL